MKFLSFKAFIILNLLILASGFIFLGGLYYFLNSDSFKSEDIINYFPVTKKSTRIHLEINNPEDNLLVFEPGLTVSGKTLPNATVIIFSNDLDFATEADQKGDFSKVINLSKGLNNLNITAYDLLGNSTSIFRVVYYSEEEL